jgi:hypothetical protein
MFRRVWAAALHLIAGHAGRDRVAAVPPGPAGDFDTMMSRPEFLRYNEREAARLRDMLATTTTPALKARLLEAIENQERLAAGEAEARELETIGT